MTMKPLGAALALLSLAACSDFAPYRSWNQYAMTGPVASSAKEFSDDLIGVRFWMDYKRIRFELTNRSAGPVTLAWNKASYIHIDGKRHAVADERSIFSRRQLDPAPTVVPPGATIRDWVAPVRNVEQLEEWTWYVYPLFDQQSPRAFLNRGKTFGLDLPVTAGETTRTYAFRFEIVNVQPSVEQLL
ncbi:MAG: hypothetical protein HQK87_09250 [Nitrospinae bacterium]|nr:hypothetical protein [Nitrospinota bacterium]